MKTHLQAHVAQGEGAIERLAGIVQQLGAHRVLLVCGRRSFEASGAARMLPDLEHVAYVHRWSDFVPNTDAEDLVHGLEVLADVAPDLILGIGGGSAMDMAKLLSAYAGRSPDVVHDAIRSGDRIEHRTQKLVMVPTTSGSGAEATHFAVVYIGDDKYSIAGPAMLPDSVILDPALSLSGSAYQRATSGIDALCQAIESLWATTGDATSRSFARTAIPLLLEHLGAFVRAPTIEAASGMSLGSHLAGRAINISKTTAPHALSYGITKQFGLSHGHAVALTLGPFLEMHANASADRLQPGVDPEQHAEAVDEILGAFGAATGAGARRSFTDLLRRIGLDPRLTAAGADGPDARDRLIASVNLERLANDPLQLDSERLNDALAAAG